MCEPCQVDQQNRRQLPDVTFFGSFHQPLAVCAEPGILFTQVLLLGKQVKTVFEGDVLRRLRAHCTAGVLNYFLHIINSNDVSIAWHRI